MNFASNNNTRNTVHCSNIALIQSDKEKYGTYCQHSHSLGWSSAHNCANRGGKSYLCVKCGDAHCLVSDFGVSAPKKKKFFVPFSEATQKKKLI